MNEQEAKRHVEVWEFDRRVRHAVREALETAAKAIESDRDIHNIPGPCRQGMTKSALIVRELVEW